MKETNTERGVWPSKLEDDDRLFAIVDGNTGEVMTLVYSSIERKGSFVRDRNAWQKVGETFFEKLEDLPRHYIEDITIDALSIYDNAEAAGKSVSILDISDTSGIETTSISKEFTVQEQVEGLIASVVIAEERELAEALIEITEKHGKFNSDDMGVWAGYETAAENENREIGVTCANCILYEGGSTCKIIDAEVEPGGYCRFALIPDGVVTAGGNSPCWDGYKQVGMKKGKNGNMVPNCVPIDASDATDTEFAAARPAPKKDRIYGSKKNKPGSAAGGKKITFSEKTTKALKNKVTEHNEKAPPGRKVTLGMLKAVYRRGSGAFSSSHRPGKTRDQWAMARVNAYLKLVKSGSPANPKYKQDNDLLPSKHPKSTNSTIEALTAAIEAELAQDGEETCPPATSDIGINLANRKKAIKVANYGPLNPQEPNDEYWKERGSVWSVTPEEAKNSLCGNCAMFSITTKIQQCIADGIASGGSGQTDAWDAIDIAELGYCEAFDFKCAASRTCDAWVTGGPITDDSEDKEEEVL